MSVLRGMLKVAALLLVAAPFFSWCLCFFLSFFSNLGAGAWTLSSSSEG